MLNNEGCKIFQAMEREVQIYPRSFQPAGSGWACLGKINDTKCLLLVEAENWAGYADFEGYETIIGGTSVKLAYLNHHNAEALRYWYPFTRPVPLGEGGFSLGLGDRLGTATPGHIRAIRSIENIKTHPVFAQQSVRELTLTGRTFEEVLDAVTFGVFQEGYMDGFGADGDHLKRESEVKDALDAGFTMITLDCSEVLDNSICAGTPEEVERVYRTLGSHATSMLEEFYLGKEFLVGEYRITFNEEELQKIVLTYYRAIEFICLIYENLLRTRQVDFEVSIDETSLPTSTQAHFFMASELKRRGIRVTSLAPRFVGEFQKGIDYIGDVQEFESQFKIHSAIADHFGYKLSIHSGSDKFKVFPIMGKYTMGRLHLKTAGTNWLEALRIIARREPSLFRELYERAREWLPEAKRFYVVKVEATDLPEASTLLDTELEQLLEKEEARQVLHLGYGFLLNPANDRWRYRIYEALSRYEEDYWEALQIHLSKHIRAIFSL